MIILKVIGSALITVASVCGLSYLTDNSKPSNWEITKPSKNSTEISWAKFEWANDTLGKKYFERTAMIIPCKIDGLPNIFTFQFDLGANYTGVYEKTFSSFYNTNPQLRHIDKRLKSSLQFWNKGKLYEDFSIYFGDYKAYNKLSYVYGNQGHQTEINSKNLNDTFHLGTVGADMFQDKILIIDYPNLRFAICDNLPNDYKNNLIDIEINKNGKIILPMKIRNKAYNILFDNGSSIFPIITQEKNISKFSTSPDIDTIQVSSWGKLHEVTGKIIKDTFELAGQRFSNVKVYANHSGLGIDRQTDGMAGNALFWDKTIIIDFKNKKFGVK